MQYYFRLCTGLSLLCGLAVRAKGLRGQYAAATVRASVHSPLSLASNGSSRRASDFSAPRMIQSCARTSSRLQARNTNANRRRIVPARTATARTSVGDVSCLSSIQRRSRGFAPYTYLFHDAYLEMDSSTHLSTPIQPWISGYDLLCTAHRVWQAAEAVPIANDSHRPRLWLDGMSS